MEFTVGVNAKLYTHFSDGTVREFQRGDSASSWREQFIKLAHTRYRNCPSGVAVARLCAVFRDHHDGEDPLAIRF